MAILKLFIRAFIAFIIGFLAILGLFFIVSQPVQAAFNVDECALVAVDNGVLYDHMIEGMTWEEAEPLVQQALEEALIRGDTYVKDRADIALMLAYARFVWMGGMSRIDTQIHIYQGCLSSNEDNLI